MENFVVALDGPAGSGKSSISKLVALKLGFTHIDTGAMYRAVTLEALRRNVHLEDESEYDFLKDVSILYKNNTIYLNGEDVSTEIRSALVTSNVSTCCKFATVRNRLVRYQRESAKEGKILMDGRDIGTVVLPNADLKIYLTASPEVRAQRRFTELKEKGVDTTYEVVLKEIQERDYKDSHREIAPMKMAEDAILLDTSDLSMEEVTERVIKLINERLRSMEDNFKMEDLNLPKKLRAGMKVSGTVVKVEDNTIYLDIKSLTEGVMHLDHYTNDKNITSFKGIVKVGDEIDCEVAKVSENKEGETSILLSRLNQLSKEAFHQVSVAKDENQDIEVKVSKVVPNKGYMVDYKGNKLFLPMSQAPQDLKVRDTLRVRVLEVEEERMNAVVSHKVIEKEEYEAAKQAELDAIQVGDALTGKVVKIEKFGVFVRFNYNQGLVRINQLAHTFTTDINAVCKVGDEMQVKVLSKDNGKLVLSRKALLDTPYEAYAKTVTVGQTVKGKVTNKLPFGLLIELADNVKGLLHQSEYSHNPNDNFNDFVKIGDEVECAILALNPEHEKISLSRKALIDNPWTRVTAKLGDVVDITVTEVLDSGLKVETLGVDGFVPGSEALTSNQNGTVKDYFNPGDKAQAEIIDIKPAEWRLRLSIKRISEKEERESFEKYLEEDTENVTIGDVFKDILK